MKVADCINVDRSYIENNVLRANPAPKVSVSKYINALGDTYNASDVKKAFNFMIETDPARTDRIEKVMRSGGYIGADDQRYLAHKADEFARGCRR